ncbi:hypothetical protein BH09PAT2_BH09PAT2_00540 [soil metagenome]
MKKFFIVDSIIIVILLLVLVYTRFVGLNWGFPYPMHPDERNIVVSILEIRCPDITSTSCLHPHFFAYGQFSIYLASILAHLIALVSSLSSEITFEHAVLALRIISASASVVTALIIIKTVTSIFEKVRKSLLYLIFLVIVFVPGFIQFSHFGTTESLLMMFFSILLYLAIRYLRYDMSQHYFVAVSGMVLGIALGTKISALVFVAIPFGAMVFKVFEGMQLRPFLKLIFSAVQLVAIAVIFFALTSPYNLIAWSDFMGSMNYESSVGLGTYRAFYTRQFEYTVPFIFQLVKILPYTLGGPLFLIAILGFIFLPFSKLFNFLRLQIIIFLLPTMIIYAKWSRFISPIFPAITLLAILYIVHILNRPLDRVTRHITTVLCLFIVAVTILPGMAYLTIYRTPDVRFVASKWIYKNMPVGAYILSETANVVDTPIPSTLLKPEDYEHKSYNYISFNHYDLDQESALQEDFSRHREQAEYIFIPSRRVFYNHTCYRPTGTKILKVTRLVGYEPDVCARYEEDYPMLNTYYDNLFSGKSGFEKVAEFTSYPRVELFGRTLLEFPDEAAEETWTVFDHPVLRIYKRM